MRIRQSSPAPGGLPVPKPTLHTWKNHDVYNGILHAPLATHVQLIPASSRSEQDPGSTQPDHKWMYLITLFYPYHRACEIYRSHEDVSGLEKLLAGMGCGVKGGITAQPGPLKNGTAEGDGEGSSKCQSCQVHGNESESHDGENANQNQTGCRHNNLKTKIAPAIMLTTPTISSQAALRDAQRSAFLTTTTTTETDTDESTSPSSTTDGLLDFYFQPPTPQPTTIPISSTETTNIPSTTTPTPRPAPFTPYPNHACARTCSCPCLGPSHHGPHSQIKIKTEKGAENAKQQAQMRRRPAIADIRDVTTAAEAAIHLQNLLSAALYELEGSRTPPAPTALTAKTTAAVVTGNSWVGIPLAWFLKRRMGDCWGG